jgi:hypothetical protein
MEGKVAIEILTEGSCLVIRAPMGDNGLEGFVQNMAVKFQKCKGPNGAEWFRVYPHEESPSYYECCGERVFFAHFKIIGKWLKEADEISPEDSEAAADLYDRLVEGAA